MVLAVFLNTTPGTARLRDQSRDAACASRPASNVSANACTGDTPNVLPGMTTAGTCRMDDASMRRPSMNHWAGLPSLCSSTRTRSGCTQVQDAGQPLLPMLPSTPMALPRRSADMNPCIRHDTPPMAEGSTSRRFRPSAVRV